jgi:predicted small secreted protein
MNKLTIAAVALMSLFMVGCSTTNTGGDNQVGGTTAVENALPYIKPAVILACTVVLEQALSPEDRVEKAKMINNVATIVQSLTVGQTPTPDQLQKALTDYLPAEKTHWAKYVVALKDIYAAQFAKLDGNGVLAVKVLNAIASGCKDATEEYVE